MEKECSSLQIHANYYTDIKSVTLLDFGQKELLFSHDQSKQKKISHPYHVSGVCFVNEDKFSEISIKRCNDINFIAFEVCLSILKSYWLKG